MLNLINRRTCIVAIIVVTLFASLSSCREETFSPSQADSFIKFFGSYSKDEGFDIKSLDDGGFMLAGTTSTENTGTDVILIRTDKYGNEVWDSKKFGGAFDDRAHSLIELDEGGFAILGSTTVESMNNRLVTNMYLLRIDAAGDTLWTKHYGYFSNEVGYNIAQTRDGGFIMIGSTESLQSGDIDILLIKTDGEGEIEWTRIHGGPSIEVGTHITETEYGFIYTGFTSSYSQSEQAGSNIFVVRTNQLGRVTYPFTYGSMGDDYGKSIIPFPEGGYLILGTTTEPESGIKNVFLARVEEDISNPVWIAKYGGQLNHVAGCMKITDEGNIVITGTQEISAGNHVIFLMETDNNGNQIYLKTYGGQGHQRGEALDLTKDGGYAITGSNELGGNSMITLIKTTTGGEL